MSSDLVPPRSVVLDGLGCRAPSNVLCRFPECRRIDCAAGSRGSSLVSSVGPKFNRCVRLAVVREFLSLVLVILGICSSGVATALAREVWEFLADRLRR